jgi:hypothetical protein
MCGFEKRRWEGWREGGREGGKGWARDFGVPDENRKNGRKEEMGTCIDVEAPSTPPHKSRRHNCNPNFDNIK